MTVNPRGDSKLVGVDLNPSAVEDLSTTNDSQILFLWSEVVRQTDPRRTEKLLRKEVAPNGPHENKIVAIGEQMTKRDLFSAQALFA